MKKIFIFLLALCLLALPTQADNRVQFVGTTFNVFTGVTAASFSGNGTTYILSVPPNETVTFYLTNTNGAQSDSITVQGFSTGSPLIPDFSNNSALWVPVSIYNSATGSYGSAAQVLTLSNAGSQVASLYFPQATAGQIALKISSGSGTGPLNLDIVASMNGQLPATFVQGLGTVGNFPVGNPVYVAGQVQSSISQNKLEPLPIVASFGGTDFGMEMGARAGTVSSASGIRLFGVGNGDIFGILPYGFDAANGHYDYLGTWSTPQNPLNGGEGSIFTTDGGAQFHNSATISTNITLGLALNSTIPGVHPGCTFYLHTTNPVGGTSPTLNSYIQDSNDGTTWNDRVSFLQMTASTNLSQVAAVSSGSMVPTAPVQATLATGTIVNGNLAPYLRVQFVVGGTSPSFPIEVFANCQ